MSFRDALLAWRRGWLGALLFFVMLLGAGTIAIRSVPPLWSSTARIAIERTDGTLRVAGTGDAAAAQALLYQRIDHLRGALLESGSLDALAHRAGFLAPGDSDAASARSRVRDALSVTIENEDVVNPYTGKLGLLPLAILVRADAASAAAAHALADGASGALLEIDAARAVQAGARRRDVLADEAATAAVHVGEVDVLIGVFRTEHALLLPELHALHVERLADADEALARARETLSALLDSRAQNEAEIAATSPEALLIAPDGTRVEGAPERLARLRIELADVRARYAPAHPTRRALEREVLTLARSAPGRDTAATERDLALVRASIEKALVRYGPEHPRRVDLLAREASLEAALLAAGVGVVPAVTSVPSSPAYQRLLARRDTLDAGLARERIRAEALGVEIEDLGARLARMPAIEREASSLERRRESAVAALHEREAALSSEGLDGELRAAGLMDTLALVQAPVAPESPSSVARAVLHALSLLVAILGALAITLLRSAASGTIHSIDALPNPERTRVHALPTY